MCQHGQRPLQQIYIETTRAQVQLSFYQMKKIIVLLLFLGKCTLKSTSVSANAVLYDTQHAMMYIYIYI